MAQQPPNYLRSDVLDKTKEKIRTPPNGTHYEHHVGSWMGTLLKNVFTGDPWALTPEQIDLTSKKKPDFAVELLEDGELVLHLLCEVKKLGGARMGEALYQATKHIAETVDEKGNRNDKEEFEVFVIVQRGLDIGFFEYHNDGSNLDADGIPNFRSCISFTQGHLGGHAILPSNIPGLKPLYYDFDRLRELSNLEQQNVRKEASLYLVPCFFNLDDHAKEINYMLRQILEKKPRSSPPH